MRNGEPWPTISIVTPSYNQAAFIEETIRSVLLQGYPNLQYVVIDGGSTDGTVDVLTRYDHWIDYWVSEPDGGQADAINKGLAYVTGGWFNWLNSDDILLPGALMTLATVAALVPEAQWISGASLFISAGSTPVDCWIPWRTNPAVLGLRWPQFPQDATFIRTGFLRQHRLALRADLTNVFDSALHWELFMRSDPVVTSAFLSAMRVYPTQKSANAEVSRAETLQVLRPLERRMPLWARVGLRLQRTRYRIFPALLGLCVRRGVTRTARSCRAVVYDRKRAVWEVKSARHAVFY